MRRIRYLSIAIFIFFIIPSASASQCSDRHLEEFNSQGGKDAWLKRVRSMQNQAKQALRTGVWSDGKKLSKEKLQQIRDGIQVLEEDIAEASVCSLPGQSASTSPPTRGNESGSAASNCPAKIIVVDTGRDYYGMHDLNSYEIVSTNPISIRANSGTRFLNSLPGSPAGDQWGEGTLLTDINSVLTKQREVLDAEQRRISSCSQGCCDSAASFCSMKRDNQARMVEWLQCVAKGSPMSSGSTVAARTGPSSTPAEQIPNCPPTLPPSCVTWSQYDQQLQLWNLTNNCGRDVSVTFRSEGALENTQTFGNGESYRPKWRGSNPPKQIVWDAAKGFGFYRNKPAGAALKCQASLPL